MSVTQFAIDRDPNADPNPNPDRDPNPEGARTPHPNLSPNPNPSRDPDRDQVILENFALSKKSLDYKLNPDAAEEFVGAWAELDPFAAGWIRVGPDPNNTPNPNPNPNPYPYP